MNLKKISLIIPAKNEKLSIKKVLEEIFITHSHYIKEIIIVVDNTDDNTINVAKKYKCKIIIQNKSGYGSAIIQGFKCAKTKYACIFNADYSFDPAYLKKMIKLTNKYDFIFGSRYLFAKPSNDDDIVTFVGNLVFSFITKFLLKINLSDILYTYVLCDVNKFNKFKFRNNDFRFCIELPYIVNNKKFKYTEIYMNERKRYLGKKNVNVFKDGFLILLEIIKCIFKI